MDVTLLGSGDAVGVPAPLCACSYCETSPRRRRPGLLVETDRATIVLDVSPDVNEQLHATGTAGVDAFFLTHHHFDHVGGIDELAHAAMGFDAHVGIDGGYLPADAFAPEEKPADPAFDVYLTETALGHLESRSAYVVDLLDLHTIGHGDSIAIGDLSVVPFPVRHAQPQFDTVGFAVSAGGSTVVYAPDMWEFTADRSYVGADLLFADGAALFRSFGHGSEADLRESLAGADADRTVLVDLNEHLQRMTTAEMRRHISSTGYELGADFDEYVC